MNALSTTMVSTDPPRQPPSARQDRPAATAEALIRAGEWTQAEALLRSALALTPDDAPVRRHLASLLIRWDRMDEAMPLLRAELGVPGGPEWIDDRIAALMADPDLGAAGRLADAYARLRWGSERHGPGAGAEAPADVPNPLVSVAKLEHDAAQLGLLLRSGNLPADLAATVDAYREIAARLRSQGIAGQTRLDETERLRIHDTYNRLLHVRASPRTERALSAGWSAPAVERAYLQRKPGIVVIDDFLTAQTLSELRAFCQESTVWFANRYAHGRLGAFFRDGFNSPLLLQIAEELRAALPNVIGDRYPLRQLWGFKNCSPLPPDSNTHADFAAVNVNFWITPESSNLDADSGGMVVYEVDAPPEWDFHTYNGSQDLIHDYLRRCNARRIRIPYKSNRAIIFNSDLFHGTEAVRFGPDYTDHRVNITMLYGQRESDVHHAPAAPTGGRLDVPSWRSAAFSRRRG